MLCRCGVVVVYSWVHCKLARRRVHCYLARGNLVVEFVVVRQKFPKCAGSEIDNFWTHGPGLAHVHS